MAKITDMRELEKQHPGIKDWSRQNFVGNECGSDEYRETQPGKGLMYIYEWLELSWMPGSDDHVKNYTRNLRLIADWMNELADKHEDPNAKSWEVSYAGADQLAIILGHYHDDLWELTGKHPYDGPDYVYLDEENINDFLTEKAV